MWAQAAAVRMETMVLRHIVAGQIVSLNQAGAVRCNRNIPTHITDLRKLFRSP